MRLPPHFHRPRPYRYAPHFPILQELKTSIQRSPPIYRIPISLLPFQVVVDVVLSEQNEQKRGSGPLAAGIEGFKLSLSNLPGPSFQNRSICGQGTFSVLRASVEDDRRVIPFW